MMSVEKTLGYSFNNTELLEQALTHPSFYTTKKQRLKINHFERLEFMGDRVLALVVGEMLYANFPEANEGELARRLAWLVCRETLAEVAKEIGIPSGLLYARATEENNTQWMTFLSDACESLIGAVYFDRGLGAAKQVITKFWGPLLHQQNISLKDPKTQLQEYSQAKFRILPKYRITQQTGPSHEPEITVECWVNDIIVTAIGTSKKIAENACAQKMLQKLKSL